MGGGSLEKGSTRGIRGTRRDEQEEHIPTLEILLSEPPFVYWFLG